MATADVWENPDTMDEKKKGIKKKIKIDDRDFTNPVFKKISLLNGEINRSSKPQLQKKLADLELDTRGDIDVLRRRLKNCLKKAKLAKADIHSSMSTKYDYLVVIDFEATCEEDNSKYQHEIIEFPAVLVDVLDFKIVSEFHAYCQPVLNPKLSAFCKDLTGITQEDVDGADTFPSVFVDMQKWMNTQRLGKEMKFAVVTDGPWDMSRFLYTQCQLCDIKVPKWCKKWINVRKIFTNFYGARRVKLETMLKMLGLEFEGRLHCGLDDTRNIARIVIGLLKDGCTFNINEYMEEVYCNEKQNTIAEVRPFKDNSGQHRSKRTHSNSSDNKDKHSVEDRLEKLNLDETENGDIEEEADDVTDLLDYYKLQNS